MVQWSLWADPVQNNPLLYDGLHRRLSYHSRCFDSGQICHDCFCMEVLPESQDLQGLSDHHMGYLTCHYGDLSSSIHCRTNVSGRRYIRVLSRLGRNAKDFSKLFALGFFVILYAIPLLLMTVLYTIIVHKLWRNRFAQSTGSGGDVNINNSKKRVVKMLVTVTLFFAICWFPLHTIHYYMYFNSQSYKCLSLYVILLSFWLGHANSAINPVLYVIFNKTFRRAFLDALYIVSFSTVNLMSTTGRRSSRRPSTTQNNGRSMSNNHKQPPSPLPQALSQRKMYGYGKLRPQSETTKSRSSEGDSQMHGKKIARYSMLVVTDKMTSV